LDNISIITIITHSRKGVKTMKLYSAQKAQGLVEYALILVLVALVVIVILALLGPAIGRAYSNVITRL
jgi:pilus assembly protein Flp/PilA